MDRITVPSGHVADDRQVLAERVRLLYLQAPVSNITIFIITALFVLILDGRLDPTLVFGWAGLMVAAASFRLLLWWRYHHPTQDRDAAEWERLYQLGSALVGISWSIIYPYFMISDDPVVSLSLLMLALGVISSSISILSVSMPAFILYSYPQALSCIAALLVFGEPGLHVLAIAVAIYLAMSTLFARNTNRDTMRSILLQGQNASLIADLNQEIGHRERIIEQRTRELADRNDDLSREVGERQRAEKRLKRANTDLDATLDAIPDLLFELDEKGRYLEIWARDPELLAAQREVLLGRSVAEMLPGEAALQVKTAIAEASIHGFSQGQVLKIPLPHGTHWFELSTAMKIVANGDRHFIMLSRDITDKQRISAELEEHRQELECKVDQRTRDLVLARDEAERLSRVKSEFLANMSHEIRTPMNGVLGIAELLAREELTHRQQYYVDTIQRSGAVLLRVINDILDFSRIESGRLEFEDLGFDITDVLLDIEQLFSAAARDKGLDLVFEIDPDLYRNRRGDPRRVTQILFNLVGNAIKFTDSGTITVQAGAQANEADEVRLEVVDTGIGIPDATQKHLFQAFQQADSSTSRKFGGSGLGLAVSQRLANLMGGNIQVQSHPGEGSRFQVRLRLPCAPQSEGTIAQALDTESIHGRIVSLRVLLAEDNPVNQLLAREMLEGMGCSVEVADDGRQAVAAVKAQAFDLILMDLHMPDMDGLDATRIIRHSEEQNTALLRTPIVALTADVMAGQRQACEQAGMDDFMAKPFKFEQLQTLLGKWSAKEEGGA